MIHPDILKALPFRTITRSQVADILGIKYESVGNLVLRGRIGQDGQRYYLQREGGAYKLDSFIHYYNKVHYGISQHYRSERQSADTVTVQVKEAKRQSTGTM